jgi:hypothetical protein
MSTPIYSSFFQFQVTNLPEDGLEFFTVKESKYKKISHIQIFEVPLSNRFEGLPEEPE